MSPMMTTTRLASFAAGFLIALPALAATQDPTQAPRNKPLLSAEHKRLQPEEAYSDTNVTLFGGSGNALLTSSNANAVSMIGGSGNATVSATVESMVLN